MPTIATSPVNVVDLPQPHVSGPIGVVVHRIGIPSTLMGHNAFAACLIPIVFATPCSNVLHFLRVAAVASVALTRWAVSTTVVGKSEGHQKCDQQNMFHA